MAGKIFGAIDSGLARCYSFNEFELARQFLELALPKAPSDGAARLDLTIGIYHLQTLRGRGRYRAYSISPAPRSRSPRRNRKTRSAPMAILLRPIAA